MSEIRNLEDEAIRICQDLIRIPSVNFGEGRGDEEAVAKYIVASLAEVGIEAKIYESAPKRCNVIARIKGINPDKPGLVVHGHIDVVPANAADWSVDPFAGEIKDGCIWGRGAVDMKNVDAMILAIVRDWAQRGYVPERDIVLAFFADEEAGMTFGSGWMTANHPEVFAGCSEAISEVGGFSVTVADGKRLYFIEAAQKGIHWMKLTAQGRAGHGSMMNDENALTALTEAVAKIGRYEWPQRYTKTVKDLFKEVARVTGKAYDEKDLRPLLKEIGSTARMIGATLQNTANPTMLEAGYKANVIPGTGSEAEHPGLRDACLQGRSEPHRRGDGASSQYRSAGRRHGTRGSIVAATRPGNLQRHHCARGSECSSESHQHRPAARGCGVA